MPKVASAKWDELIPILVSRSTLAIEDGAVLEAFCRTYATWARYQAIAERAALIKTPYGPRVNPAAAESRRWETRLTQLGDRMGLNASSRSRVSAGEGGGGGGIGEAPKGSAEEFFFRERPALAVVNGGKPPDGQ